MSANTNNDGGIRVISESSLEDMGPREKIRKVIKNAKRGDITVLEKQLSDKEQSDLIDEVMSEVRDTKDFTGVDLDTTESSSSGGGLFARFKSDKSGEKLMIITPSSKVDSIDKDADGLKVLFRGDN